MVKGGRELIYFLKDVINDLLGKEEEEDTMVKAIEDKVILILRIK